MLLNHTCRARFISIRQRVGDDNPVGVVGRWGNRNHRTSRGVEACADVDGWDKAAPLEPYIARFTLTDDNEPSKRLLVRISERHTKLMWSWTTDVQPSDWVC